MDGTTIATITPIVAVCDKVEHGYVQSADAFVEQALSFYLEYAEGDTDFEYRDTSAAIQEALEEGERGEGRPAEEVFLELRARHL